MERVEKQLTAVEWLVEMLVQECGLDDTGDSAIFVIEKAKAMEKEQIIEAFAKGSDEESDYHGFQFITPDKAIEYYNKTFKSE